MALESVEQEIRTLRARLWSDADPQGRAFASLADAHRRAGELETAAALLADGLERHPDFATAHVVAGLVHRDMGNREKAERAFESVLELDPENVIALDEVARLAAARGDRQRALERLTRLRDLDASDPTLDERIRSLEGEEEEARSLSEEGPAAGEAERLAADEAEAEPLAADEAEAEPPTAGPAAEVPPPGAEHEDWSGRPREGEVYTRTMAELYARQGLYGRAAHVYERLLEKEPEDTELRTRLEAVRAPAAEASQTEAPSPRQEEPDLEEDDRAEADFVASEATLAETDLTLEDFVAGEPEPLVEAGGSVRRDVGEGERATGDSGDRGAAEGDLEDLELDTGSPGARTGLAGAEAEEPEALAPQWLEGEEDRDEEVSTPFAWSGAEEEAEERSVAQEPELPVSRYFESLLSWVPGAVPVESLAPDEPVESASPAPPSETAPVEEPATSAEEASEPAREPSGLGEEASPEAASSDPSDPAGSEEPADPEETEETDEDDDFQEWLRSLRS